MSKSAKIFFVFALACILSAPVARAHDSKATEALVSGKSYQIHNVKYGDLLRPKDANNADGTPIVLYSPEPWKCMTWKLQDLGKATYTLQNHFTSKTFIPSTSSAASTTETPVIQTPFPKTRDAAPQWQITPVGDGSFKIADAKSGRVLTAKKGFIGAASIVLEAWTNDDSQKWKFVPIDPASLTM